MRILPSLCRFSFTSFAFVWHKFASVVAFLRIFVTCRSFSRPVSSNLLTIQPSHAFSHVNHIQPNWFIPRRRFNNSLKDINRLLFAESSGGIKERRHQRNSKTLQKLMYISRKPERDISVYFSAYSIKVLWVFTLYHVRGCFFGGSDVGSQLTLFKPSTL